jgi:dipeptidyl-peptidase-4
MNRSLLSGWLLSVLLSLALNVSGQQLTIEQAVTQRGLYPVRQSFIWGGPSGGYLLQRNGSLVSVQARNQKETVILTREELNKLLQQAGLQPMTRLPMPDILPSGHFRFHDGPALVEYDWKAGKLTGFFNLPEKASNLVMSPAGDAAAFTTGQNVFIRNSAGTDIQVTHDTVRGIVNGQTVSRNEFGINGGLFWSPAGNCLAFYRKDERKVPEYPLVDIMTTPATPLMIRYPMAGGPSEVIGVGVYDLENGRTVFLDENAFRDDRYLTNVTWDPAGNFIFIAVLNREQNHMLLNQYDSHTGKKIRTLFEETSDKYVEPLHGPDFNPADPAQFIWQSERDGYNHLYLYRTDGSLIRQLTHGEWVVTDLLGWDPRGKYVYVRGTDPSPLERQVYRVETATGNRIRLTDEDGTHEAEISPDGRFLIDSWSSRSVPYRVRLAEIAGGKSRILYDAPNPVGDTRLGIYKPFTIKAADKRTDLYGYLVLPPDLDTDKRYPVIVYVYGGPHAQLVTDSWMGGASGWQHYMAEQGYICMTLDNRGSDARGRDFEQVIHRHLGQAEMADQMEGINYLLSLPYVDPGRIGVHGWSFGGFMTTSLMLNYPDVFKVGVAGGPVTDWRYYEVMYGERYMDMPSENPEGYELTSTLNRVRNLRGRLMMIHGDNDSTVVWQNSLMFLRKCIDEGKLVDYMVYPQHPHNVRGIDRIHLMRTVTRYFEEHL